MALIPCSECRKEVSDRATACAHCGNPVRATLRLLQVAVAGVVALFPLLLGCTQHEPSTEQAASIAGKWENSDMSAPERVRIEFFNVAKSGRSGIARVRDQYLVNYRIRDGELLVNSKTFVAIAFPIFYEDLFPPEHPSTASWGGAMLLSKPWTTVRFALDGDRLTLVWPVGSSHTPDTTTWTRVP